MNIRDMKKQNEEVVALFRNKLAHAEMPVREPFWGELEKDIPLALRHHKKVMYRLVAAASVFLILGGSSVLFWVFSPEEEIARAFSEAEVNKEAILNGTNGDKPLRVEVEPEMAVPVMTVGGKGLMEEPADVDSATFTISMSISIASTEGSQRRNNINRGTLVGGLNETANTAHDSQNSSGQVKVTKQDRGGKWAVKAALGTSLPAGQFEMPLSIGLMAERQLNRRLALESGLVYSMLRGDGRLHYLGIPLKLNIALAQSKKIAIYASAGGILEKCIAGAPDNGFDSEPLQLAVTAGVGVRYNVNNHLALFAEPGVSHYFDTDSRSTSVRTGRPTNLNLLCGVRMTY
jgi:hypothetical protein